MFFLSFFSKGLTQYETSLSIYFHTERESLAFEFHLLRFRSSGVVFLFRSCNYTLALRNSIVVLVDAVVEFGNKTDVIGISIDGDKSIDTVDNGLAGSISFQARSSHFESRF